MIYRCNNGTDAGFIDQAPDLIMPQPITVRIGYESFG
jgi:hypothetical protein